MTLVLLDITTMRRALGITADTVDTDLTRYMTEAEEKVAQIVGPLAPTAVTEVMRGAGTLVLTTLPVISLTSVTGEFVGSISNTLVTVNAYGVVRPVRFQVVLFDDYYTVVYQAGWVTATCPTGFTTAAELICKDRWAARNGNSTRRQGGDETVDVPGVGRIPELAWSMLQPYAHGPSVG
ncbi:MAG TPA: hypothetical protein VIU37_05670 [Candidatus Limnocylindrales bacterium]